MGATEMPATAPLLRDLGFGIVEEAEEDGEGAEVVTGEEVVKGEAAESSNVELAEVEVGKGG